MGVVWTVEAEIEETQTRAALNVAKIGESDAKVALQAEQMQVDAFAQGMANVA